MTETYNPTPRAEYSQRLAERQTALAREDRQHRTLGNLRLWLFAAMALILWLALARHASSVFWAIVPLAGFIVLVIRHQTVLRRMQCAQRAVDYYTRGLARLDGHLLPPVESGERFANANHPYTADLDIFGAGSLFERLSTARTRAGEDTLARWLQAPAPADVVRARQQAVEELRGKLDLREDLAVLGEDLRSGVHPEALRAWSLRPPVDFPAWSRPVARVLSIIALGLVIAFVGTLFVNIPVRLALIAVGLVEAAFFYRFRLAAQTIAEDAGEPGHDLTLLSSVLRRIEDEQFDAPLLREIRAALDSAGEPPSRRIARLATRIEMLDSRDNVFVRVFGPVLLWTTQLAFSIEQWRAESGAAVPRWLSAVGDFEALSSLAGYAFEHPAYPFPEIVSGPPLYDGVGLAHPLLPAAAVPNDVTLDAQSTRLFLISGSNMSGKSTLLRTVGVNAVLAQAGSVVRAASLRLSALSVGASLRATDSLQGGTSRFYAEIQRLRHILELPEPVLFLLDELLAGTNSHDRRIGAEGVIRGLLARASIGCVTTHDLALAGIADALAPAAANVHFEDYLEHGAIAFDYHMRPGVVTRSNALELMRAVGLPL